MPSELNDLFTFPIVQAPMAGGASCPQLAAAVLGAGGLAFLAAGYKTPAAMYEEIRQLRAVTDRPFGVNLFMPQPAAPPDPVLVEAYAAQLAGEADWYATMLGDPEAGTDDAFDAKVAVLLDEPVAVVSFTFGCPKRAVLDAFARVGTLTVVTVTSVVEAQTAQWAGADVICVQGAEAGGHQGGFRNDPRDDNAARGLLTLLTEVLESVRIPVIAGGGLMRGAQIAAVLAAGASAAQLGTAFLVCPESGANALHKRAVTSGVFTRTELTRAFSGRPARGLVNRFVREHGPYAPAAYPQVHHLTSPLRAAAARASDAQGMALWAGQGHRLARELPAAELVELLARELAEALGGATQPPDGAEFGGMPSAGAEFGGTPSGGVDFGGMPSGGAEFGGMPSRGAEFGGSTSGGGLSDDVLSGGAAPGGAAPGGGASGGAVSGEEVAFGGTLSGGAPPDRADETPPGGFPPDGTLEDGSL